MTAVCYSSRVMEEDQRVVDAHTRAVASRADVTAAQADRNQLLVQLRRRHPGRGAVTDLARATGMRLSTVQRIINPARGVLRRARGDERATDRLTADEIELVRQAQARVTAAIAIAEDDKDERDRVLREYHARFPERGTVAWLAWITGMNRVTVSDIVNAVDPVDPAEDTT
jgi:hypothetical protein